MELYFYIEDRLILGKDNKIYNFQGVNTYALFLSRYLQVFSKIIVVARVLNDPNYNGNEKNLVEGTGVKVIPLPYYVGPWEYMKVKKETRNIIKSTINNKSAYILRNGNVARIASAELKKNKIKYSVEVVGDPFDVFSKGGVKHPLRLFFKYAGYFDLKKLVKGASTAMYVTKEYLQRRYPCKNVSFSVSDVRIFEEEIKNNSKRYEAKSSFKLISVGSLEQMYKSPDIVLKSIQLLNEKGYGCSLKWIGSGKYMESMKNMAEELGIKEKVDFLGFISNKQELIDQLDYADFFVLASRTEGLPRVIPEAFARALPVIGTKVGGIPELLQEDLLIDVNNPKQLADKIIQLIENPSNAEQISRENLEKAKEFSENILQQKRIEFYQKVKDTSF